MSLRPTLAAIVTAIACAAALLAPAPAMAAPESPVLISPGNGFSLPTGSRGPVVIDFDPDDTVNYDVLVRCGDYDYLWAGSRDNSSGRVSFKIDPLVGQDGQDLTGMECGILVTDLSTFDPQFLWTFTVGLPNLSLGDVSASHATFYPLVKDGYLDTTDIRFVVNRPADATLTVKNTAGHIIYRETRSLRSAGRHNWTWSGRTAADRPLERGTYRASVAATADGLTTTRTIEVQVASTVVTRQSTLHKTGYNGRASTRGNCHVSWDTYEDSADLDCWGGSYARTAYVFDIPANATDIHWTAATGRSAADTCCTGHIRKTGRRISPTRYEVRVEVTGWRATYVYSAKVSFKARVRI